MNKDEIYYLILDLLRDLISVPRYSREESRGTDILEKFFNDNNEGEYRLNRVENNLVVLPVQFDTSKPTILLNSHIDTVRPVVGWSSDPHNPVIDYEKGILQGLGANDAGASLVTLAGTFLYLVKNDLPTKYNLVFLASAEEEISGKNGFEKVKPLLPEIDVAIVGEPTGMNPAVAEKGLIVIDGYVRGRSGHAARDEGDNAIYKALPVVSALRCFRFPKISEWLGPVKINITCIEGGTQHNVVPDLCKFVVDVRTTDSYSNEETVEILRKAVPDDCELVPRSLRLRPSHISTENPLVSRLIALGKEPFGSPTLSDQALMPWPSVKIGPGESSRSHTADEFIVLEELREAIEIYTALLR